MIAGEISAKGQGRCFPPDNVITRTLLLAFAMLTVGEAATSQTIKVPQGRSILVDGKISTAEWADAAKIELGGGAQLFVKQHDDYVLLAVIFPTGNNGFVDLFIAPDSREIFDLHASAKLGERATSTPDKWPDWSWWNNKDWIANGSRVESFDEKKFLPENAREFQIKRTRFPGKEWRVRLVLSVDHGQNYSELRLPEAKPAKGSEQWLTLRL
jgi:hypothetical protein